MRFASSGRRLCPWLSAAAASNCLMYPTKELRVGHLMEWYNEEQTNEEGKAGQGQHKTRKEAYVVTSPLNGRSEKNNNFHQVKSCDFGMDHWGTSKSEMSATSSATHRMEPRFVQLRLPSS
ncbi:hypothetical protein E2C01_021385 [Portunus trituberculatus]|uniref:Uncharacterized protein n=1 Tax=Portunus trituberculatus TaxID=210409 RepID=A0A5B7E2K0_PORTR|nr:hypothetical protein [Portunus trituberculatus]